MNEQEEKLVKDLYKYKQKNESLQSVITGLETVIGLHEDVIEELQQYKRLWETLKADMKEARLLHFTCAGCYKQMESMEHE